MRMYKSSGYDSDVHESFKMGNYRDRNRLVAYTGDSCHCGRNCSGACPNDSSYDHRSENAFIDQEGGEFSFLNQESAELIWVKESCNITVNSTDTQAGVSLQVGLQLAIALVLNISIADSAQREAVSQELMQQFQMTQKNKQKIFIYNTKDAVVTTQDADIALNIQALLQVLVALVLLVDIL